MIDQELNNLLDECRQNLKIISSIYDKKKISEEIILLEQTSQAQDFWSTKEPEKIMSRLSDLQETRTEKESLEKKLEESTDLSALFDQQIPQELIQEIKDIAKSCLKLKIKLILSGNYDSNPCFLAINPGAGGTESQDWAEMLLRMYRRFCEESNFQFKIIDLQNGDGAGIKSATISINGKNAYGLLKSENGIHRLVRISPFDSNKRRHTSFASVLVTPEVPEAEITINPEDIRIDTFRSGGKGGQSVNTTDSAIRITHIPTGTVVQCQNERSQGQNKQQAMKMLMAKLVEAEEEKRLNKEAAREKKKIEWGSQIRSYVLHPYKMVKDHRTDFQSPQPELVLDGNLEEFINAYLQEFA